jgi:hypothetical protein
MTMHEPDDDFEPEFAPVPEGEQLVPADAAAEGVRVRRAAIGITAGSYNGMALIPRAEANGLLRSIHAEPLPFGCFIGYGENGRPVEIRHLDILTPICERYFPDVTEFLYAPTELLEPMLRGVGIEPVPLPGDFMDPFERGLARYAIYGS